MRPYSAKLIISALIIFTAAAALPARPIAEKGILDLTSHDFNTGKSVSLDGDWEFYWDRTITPGYFNKSEKPDGYYPVFLYWTARPPTD